MQAIESKPAHILRGVTRPAVVAFILSHLVTIAVFPDSASPKNMNFTILPRPLVVGLFSANFCARELILCSAAKKNNQERGKQGGGGVELVVW